jgi:hypothetical protein
MERRSPAAARARLSRRQTDREVGFGQSETDVKGAATRRILELIRELEGEGLL